MNQLKLDSMQICVPLWRVPFGLTFTLYPINLDRQRIFYRETNPTTTNPLVRIGMYEDGVFTTYYHVNINRSVYIDVEYEHLLLPHITYRRTGY